MKVYQHYILLILLLLFFTGCNKFLDESPDKKLAIPATLADCKGLLRYQSVMIVGSAMNEVSADNYYLRQQEFNALSAEGLRRAYTWQPDEIFDNTDNDWARQYRRIYYCNTVLTALDNIAITPLNEKEWKALKGEALFMRAISHLQVADIWAPAYNEAAGSLGIPLRLNDDFNEVSVRATVQQSYEQVVTDLTNAAALLPALISHPTVPSKPAAFAYLSRSYLAMGRYEAAGKYADSCLQLKAELLDYNNLNATAAFPFAEFNAEQVFHNVAGITHLLNDRMRIDTSLYKLYSSGDCRKTLFFKNHTDGSIAFKGNYNGNGNEHFAGIATDEMYLTRAECYARTGNYQQGLQDLNTLLQKRMKPAAYVPVAAPNSAAALDSIVRERRKQLPLRFIRWMDIKRLNRDGAGIVLKRIMNNQEYVLPPNDLRYALPLPEDVIQYSGMPQNPR